VGLAAEMMRLTRRRFRPLGLRPEPMQVDRARLGGALGQILADDNPAERLVRLARAEPLATVADASHKALRERRVGWTRRVDADPCPLCASWADGKVRAATARMARHVGCACMAEPVLS